MSKTAVHPFCSRIRRTANVALVLAFCVALCLPAWKTYRELLRLPRQELAAIVKSPMWKVSRSFPGQFEALFDVYFGFRGTLLRSLQKAKVGWFNVSSSTRVVLGKDGWLYYVPMPVGDDHLISRPFAPEMLQQWVRMLQARRDWLAEQGIPFVLLITPDKQTIYPESLPRSLRKRTKGESRLDQLIAYLRGNTDIQVIDVRPALFEAKAQDRLYDLTDSHWNDRGAYVAYAVLIKELSRQFPELTPVARQDFGDAETSKPGGDCARLVGLPRRFPELSLSLVPKQPRLAQRRHVEGPYSTENPLRPFATEHPNRTLPRAIMFHDSFGAHLIPYLSEHFQHMVYAWVRPDSPYFDRELVLRERPNIVIQQIVERKLGVYCPNGEGYGDPLCEIAAAWSRVSERAE